MQLEINNIEYNLIKKKMKQLRDTYMQSNDQEICNVVKEQVFFELGTKINSFADFFAEFFEKCEMNSLKEIDDLEEAVLALIKVVKLPQIEYERMKKKVKMPEKNLKRVVKNYNEAVLNEPLTYYSQQIDEKKVFVFPKDEECLMVLCDTSRYNGGRKILCDFCNGFRTSDEILFVSNTIKLNKEEYSTLGLNCCSDYIKCNQDILQTEKLTDFLRYGKEKIKSKRRKM